MVKQMQAGSRQTCAASDGESKSPKNHDVAIANYIRHANDVHRQNDENRLRWEEKWRRRQRFLRNTKQDEPC